MPDETNCDDFSFAKDEVSLECCILLVDPTHTQYKNRLQSLLLCFSRRVLRKTTSHTQDLQFCQYQIGDALVGSQVA